jgi:predicted transcriptional regulator
MAKRTNPDESDAKIVIYSRISPATVAALDEICDAMRPKPTRAQLIDAALAEYVERHGKAGKRQKAGE